MAVHVEYHTDPVCPWSWAAEPALRRVVSEFAGEVEITYVMGGFAARLEDPVQVLGQALEARAASGMPVDGRAWLSGRAPRSSHPACQAVKAAAEQGVAAAYLRVLRERLWLRGAALDTPAALQGAAREVPGLDLPRFELALRSAATLEAFGADLERHRALPEPALPTFVIAGGPTLSGRVGVADLRDAVVAAGARPRPLPAPAEAVRRHGPMTTTEVAAVCDLPWPRAAAALWQEALDFRLRCERLGGGELWSVA